MVTPVELSVASFKKKKRRTSESSFEDRFAQAVRRAGRESYHPQYKEPGWPDRYINGGAWAELKVLDELAANTKSGLRKEQVPNMRERVRSGDDAFYFAKYQDTLIALPFAEFDRLGLSPLKAKLAGHCYAYKDIDEVVKCLIHRPPLEPPHEQH
jgi:hypothetical protein